MKKLVAKIKTIINIYFILLVIFFTSYLCGIAENSSKIYNTSVLFIVASSLMLCLIIMYLRSKYLKNFDQKYETDINSQKQLLENEVKEKEKLEQITALLNTQTEILNYISKEMDLNKVTKLTTKLISEKIGIDTCTLVLYDRSKNSYITNINSKYGNSVNERIKNCLKKKYFKEYLKLREIDINNFAENKNEKIFKGRDVKSFLVIPLSINNKNNGIIIVESSIVNFFNNDRVRFFSGISNQISIAVNNAYNFSVIKEQSLRDGLTGIYNKKTLRNNIKEYIEKARTSNKDISLILFDIDKFKNINDTYGHMFGDRVIIMVAKVAQKAAIKNKGKAYRFGGEEFVVVIPECDLESTYKIAKELHNEVKNTPLELDGKNIFTNISIGISSYPSFAENGEELILRADAKMYFSKQNGRGQITCDSFVAEGGVV